MPSPYQSVTIVQGDLLPLASVYLVDQNGDAVDLSLASGVTFRMSTLDGTNVINDAAASVLQVAGQSNTTGLVAYPWQAGDTSSPGVYKAWFTVTTNGKKQTYPKDDSLRVVINAKP